MHLFLWVQSWAAVNFFSVNRAFDASRKGISDRAMHMLFSQS